MKSEVVFCEQCHRFHKPNSRLWCFIGRLLNICDK